MQGPQPDEADGRRAWHPLATGWYVDSVNVANVGVCTANGLFYDGFESGDLGVWSGKAP